MVLHYRLCSGIRNISSDKININAMDQIIDIAMLALMFGLIFFASMMAYYFGQKFIDFLEQKLK